MALLQYPRRNVLWREDGFGRLRGKADDHRLGHSSQTPDQYQPLVPGGPPAYQTDVPLGAWAVKTRELGILALHSGATAT